MSGTLVSLVGCAPDLSELTRGFPVDASGPALASEAGAGDEVDGRASASEHDALADEGGADAHRAREASWPGDGAEAPEEASELDADARSLDHVDAPVDGAERDDGDGAVTVAGDESTLGLDGSSCAVWVGKFGGGYAQIANPVRDDFTIETWLKPAVASKRGPEWWYGTPLLWADVAGPANDFAVAIVNDRLAFSIGGGVVQAGDFAVIGSTTVPLGVWTHVSVTRSRSTGVSRLYVNGQPDGTSSAENLSSLGASSNLLIGNGTPTPDNGFVGALRDLRFWSVVRTEEQIRATMHATLTGTEAGLSAMYPFDEGQGVVAHDRVGTNHAALLATTTWESSSLACSTHEP